MMLAPLQRFEPRGADPTGHGWYGAPRSGGRKHKGLDLIARPGETIFSPIDGVLVRTGQVYGFTKKFRLVVIKNKTYEVKLMYMVPFGYKTGQAVTKGAPIGVAQAIERYWGKGMINHIHLEVRKYGLLTDPEPLLIKSWL